MTPRHVIFAIAISLVWGINFVAAKAAVAHFPTFLLLTIRLAIVVGILLPFMKKPMLPISKLFNIAVVLTVIHFGFMFASLENGLDSAVAVVVDQLRVPFAVILGYFLFGERISKRGALGIAVALIGTFVIVGTPNVINNYYAFMMIICGAAAWAIYNVQAKNLESVDVLSFIGWMSLLGLPQLCLLSLLTESNHIEIIISASALPIASLLYLSIAATIVAHGGWYYLLRIYPIKTIVPYTLLVPVFGMVAGLILLDEELTWQIVVGAMLTIMGVFVVTSVQPKAIKGGETT